MEIKTNVEGRTLTVRLRGELDHHGARELMERMDRLIEQNLPAKTVLDLEGLSFMDSSGIGVIMGRYKNIRLVGGRVSAAHVNERVEKIMRMSGLLKFITVEHERSWDAPDRKGGSYGTHE